MPLEPSIRVVLADDNLIVREGVRALLSIAGDVEVVAVAGDYDELLAGAAEHLPQVVVTDIRMPPDFTDEGIRAARIVRKRQPGTGVVILSQYDEPEYAISLLSEGGGRVRIPAQGPRRRGRSARESGTRGEHRRIDARPADRRCAHPPVSEAGGLSGEEERLLRMVAEGKPIKAIAASLHATPTSVGDDIEQLFLKLAQQASAGTQGALERLRLLHKVIIDREEQGESLSRMLPGGIAQQMRENGVQPGRTERPHGDRPDVRHPRVLDDRRGVGPVGARPVSSTRTARQ